MSKYDLMKKISQNKKTTDSSKQTQQKTQTQTQTKKQSKTIQSAQPSSDYWQAQQQQTTRQQAPTQTKKKTVLKTMTQADKERAQRESRYQRIVSKVQEKERNKAANVDNTYAQASAILRGEDPRKVSNWQVRQEQEKAKAQAEIAQSNIDKARKQIDSNAVTKAVSDTGLATLGGLTSGIGGQFRAASNIAQGIGGLIGDKDLINAGRKFDQELGIEQAVENVRKNNMVSNNMVGQVAESIGGMLPTIAGNVMSGGSEAIGLGLMGLSSFGNEGSNAFNRLASDGDLSAQDAYRALTSGALKAGLEVGTEQISSLFPGLDTFAFTNPDHILGQMGGEALEEAISSALEPLINPLSDPNMKNGLDYGRQVYENTFGNAKQYGGDIVESALLGGATSLAMGAPANINRIATEAPYANAINQAAENYAPDNSTITPTNDRFVQYRNENDAPNPGIDLEYPARDVEVRYDPNEANFSSSLYTPSEQVYDAKDIVADNRLDPESMDYIKENAKEAVVPKENPIDTFKTKVSDIMKKFKPTSTDGSTTIPQETAEEVTQAIDDAVDAIGAETDIPGDVLEEMTGRKKINKTAIKEASGKPTGMVSDVVSELNVKETGEKIKQMTPDVTYTATMFDPVTSNAAKRYEKRGGMDRSFDSFISEKTEPTRSEKTKKVLGNMLSIETDFDLVNTLADGLYLKGQMETELNRFTNEIKSKGYELKTNYSPTGETSYQLIKDGKIVDPPEMSQTMKDLTNLKARHNLVSAKVRTMGHNLGTGLVMLRTNSFSPDVYAKEVNDFVAKINKELDAKFKSQIKNGNLSHVKLNEDLVNEMLEATDDATRNEAIVKIGVDIADQVPHSFIEKLDAFRHNNMLFNPLTWARNLGGNGGMSAMAKAKDLHRYAIESAFKAAGKVRYNNLDMSDANDKALVNHTTVNSGKTLFNDFAEAKKSGNVKKYLKGLGYDGALLNTLNTFKGSQFDLSDIDSDLNSRFEETVANKAKENGYTVKDGKLFDKNGSEISQESYRKLINESFKKAKQQWLSAESLRMAKVDSAKSGHATKSQKQVASEMFDILNPQHENVAGMMSDNIKTGTLLDKAYNEAHRREVFSNKNPFGFLENKMSKITNFVMNDARALGDEFWIEHHYSSNMARMLDSQGYHAEINDGTIELYDRNGDQLPQNKADSILAKINKDAYQEALENTFHDPNDLANLLNDIERTNLFTKVLMNSLQPYIKTPLNIARRAIEYSPIGLGVSLSQLNRVKQGEISASTWLNNLSKGATGATAMAIGAWLASLGILKANGDEEDENIKRFEQSKGIQNYSIQIPGVDGWSASIDWMAPGISPFLLGAAMFEEAIQYKPSSEDENKALSALKILGGWGGDLGTIFKPLADTTMMSGLMDTLDAAINDDTKEFDPNGFAGQFVQNYTRQLSPVLASKVHGIFDPIKYSSASDSFIDRQVRAAAVNLRLIDYALTAINGEQYLQPQLDLNGQPVQTQDYGLGAAGRAITNLVNPATVKNDTRDSTDTELERVYRETGDYGILPRQQTYLNQTKFTPEERTEYNQYYLSEYKKAAEEFINSYAYRDYDDKTRSKILMAMSSHYKSEATAKYLGRIEPNASSVLTDNDKACDYVNSLGVSTAKYYGYLYTPFEKDKNGDSINNTRAMKIRAQMEADGVWDEVKKAIKGGKFEAGKFNLNNAVTGWSTEDFTYYYKQMLDGTYDGTYKKKKKK